MTELTHHLSRSVVIKATPDTVYRFFTDSARWASWWGVGSSIDATPGGRVYIRYPNGVEASGEVLEAQPGAAIVFTFGYASGKPIPPGSSRVTIRLEPIDAGTRLHLLHEFADAESRDEHIQGWRFQLSVFANIVANEVFADAEKLVDAWFEAWAVTDGGVREASFARFVSHGIQFRDRYSLLEGLSDLTAHTGAVQRFMPNLRMQRKGAIRHCQGIVLADWIALNAEAKEVMAGTNVFALDADGKIASVTGLANPQ